MFQNTAIDTDSKAKVGTSLHTTHCAEESSFLFIFALLPEFRQSLLESRLSVPPFTNRKSGENQARRLAGNRPSQPATNSRSQQPTLAASNRLSQPTTYPRSQQPTLAASNQLLQPATDPRSQQPTLAASNQLSQPA